MKITRKSKQWHVISNGRTVFTHKDYPTAALMLVAFTDPDLYAITTHTAEKTPQLASRAIAAAVLIARGHYHYLDRETPSQYADHNHSRHHVHLERHDGELYPTCTCGDFTQHHAPQLHGRTFCKHILAHMMLSKLCELTDEEEIEAE